MITNLDLQTEKYIINRYVSMPKLFDSLGIDYRINGNMFCPFHQNERTPSAHLYNDESGYRLWCFSEGRMYGAWDIYHVYYPKINTNDLAKLILNKFSEEEQKKIIDDMGIEQEEDLVYKKELQLFKRSKITITELLKVISDSYVDKA